MLLENFVEMAPIIYTPTVGWACMNYHKLYHRPRGMYFSAADRGMMVSWEGVLVGPGRIQACRLFRAWVGIDGDAC